MSFDWGAEDDVFVSSVSTETFADDFALSASNSHELSVELDATRPKNPHAVMVKQTKGACAPCFCAMGESPVVRCGVWGSSWSPPRP